MTLYDTSFQDYQNKKKQRTQYMSVSDTSKHYKKKRKKNWTCDNILEAK